MSLHTSDPGGELVTRFRELMRADTGAWTCPSLARVVLVGAFGCRSLVNFKYSYIVESGRLVPVRRRSRIVLTINGLLMRPTS